MSHTENTPDMVYEANAGAALREFQAGQISFYEWNRRQTEAANEYRAAIAKQRGVA